METFDCPMRELTLQFAHHIQPHLSMVQLQEIADALNGSPEAQNCNLSAAELFSNIKHQISTFRTPHIWSDLSSARETENILKVYVSNEYGSDSDHSGLSIESPFKTIHFALHKVRELRNYSISPNAMIIIKEGVYHFDSPLILNHFDSNLLITNFNNESVTISGSIPLYNCSWTLYQHTPDGHDVYSVDLKNSLTLKLIDNVPFDGLRVNGRRAIRARFPNTDPELDGFGSTLLALEWFPSKIDAIPEIEVNPKDIPVRNDSNEFMYYQAGIGGICNVFDPPMGYWCGNMTEGGGAATYQVPSGLRYNSSILPHAPYRNTTNGIVSVWHPSHWATWHFKMGKVDDEIITFSSGGFQDARGGVKGKEFFVENVFEELDAPNEWYYDETQSLLFYVNNMTDGQQPSCGDGVFTVTNLKTLVRFEGNQSFPVRNVTIRGMFTANVHTDQMGPDFDGLRFDLDF